MIRLADKKDLDAILKLYAVARKYMADNGNATQWPEGYPDRELLQRDIREKHLFVDVEKDEIHGVFAFILGPDETYLDIEDGSWKNDDPYGTIHRLAGDGAVKGVFSRCLDFCKQRSSNLRIDTHENNRTMRHLIEKNGFERCGIIYVPDETPRIAYQYVQRQ